MRVYRGTLIHSKRPEALEVLQDYLVGFQEQGSGAGEILFLEQCEDIDEQATRLRFDKNNVVCLKKGQFLIPGFIDTHIHAPQYKNSGVGYELDLLDWLDKYTYPTETIFKSVDVAKELYPKAVSRSLTHGTTTACYFATIHLDSTKELCRIISSIGQRVFVGKVNMDQESPEHYVEETEQSLRDTEKFVEFVRQLENPCIQPVITPRFAPSCSPEILSELGDLAKKKNLHIQSHICEQKSEVEYTLEVHKGHKYCASIFEKAGLLTDKTVMAHCIYLEEEEIELFRQREVGISHCPVSNLCLSSGILNVRKLLARNMKVGLGTDISGGYSPSILEAMRMAVHSSKAISFKGMGQDDLTERVLTHNEAFYLGTLGGAKVLAIEDKVGNFEVGKQFDALLIDTNKTEVFDTFHSNSIEELFMKYFYLGDDRNIAGVFVAGKEVPLL